MGSQSEQGELAIMKGMTIAGRDKVESLIRHLANSARLEPSYVVPFSNFLDCMAALLTHIRDDRTSFIAAGHAAPEVEIAAHRAGMTLDEVLGASPFICHAEDILERLSSDRDIIYLANPNWVTGASYASADIDRLVQAIPRGVMIVDEKYVDFDGISVLSLLNQYRNVVLLRSVTTAFGIDADSSGYVVALPEFVTDFKQAYDWTNMSTTLMTILTTTLVSDDARSQRLTMLRDEALRVSTRLTQLGVQNRMTSADFLLLRVASPAQVGNFLVRHNIAPENLDGYPDLKNYLRYRLRSPLSNETFLSACARMPRELYHLDTIDRRAVTLHRPARLETSGEKPVVDRDIPRVAVRSRKVAEPTSR
jgi:histidinol-phosphate/aromatic aminotransferase/cobyric acid decarboxylase-like protein